MIRMFVRHPVRDFTAWKRHYDGFDEERTEKGVRAEAVFQAAEDPNDVTVWHDFDTLDEAHEFASWGRLGEVMEEAGVSGEPTIWFTREA